MYNRNGVGNVKEYMDKSLGMTKIAVYKEREGKMIFENAAGLITLGGLTVVMLLVVPWERIRALLTVGLLFGVVLPFIIIGVMQNWLGFWSYRGVDPVTVAGIPVFLAITWFPSVIVFSHLLAQYRSPLLRILLWLAVAAAVVALQYALMLNNMLVLQNWTFTGTFFLTLFIHAGLAAALHFMGHLDLRSLLKTP
jgi:hypothetical protein